MSQDDQRPVNVIHPESAFGAAFKGSIDLSEFATDRRKREQAVKNREAQQAKGNNGTIWGLSPKSDEEIARNARIRKCSQLG